MMCSMRIRDTECSVQYKELGYSLFLLCDVTKLQYLLCHLPAQ